MHEPFSGTESKFDVELQVLHVLLLSHAWHPVIDYEHYLHVPLSLSKYFVDKHSHFPFIGLTANPLSLSQIVQ